MLQAADITIRLNPADDVVIARVNIPGGTTLPKEANVRLAVTVPAGHKIAVREIKQGAPVRRYNQIIGFATRDIEAGEHVHLHNLAMGDFERDYAFCVDAQPTEFIEPRATFDGIVRADGRVATRNYIGILTSVNCSATVARMIAGHFEEPARLRIPTSTVSSRLPIKPAAAWRARARACDSCAARSRAMRAIRISSPRSSSGLGCESNQIEPPDRCAKLERSDQLAAYHHPGKRRHHESGARRHRPHRGHAAGGEQGQARERAGQPPDARRCNAAARTAIRASPPIRRSALRSTCWCATAARPSCRKRRRSTAPSIC